MRGSPCRSRATGTRRHHCSWWHASLVEGYRTAAEAQRLRAEAATLGYATELAAYWATVERRLTFRAWLIHYREDAAT